MHRDDAGNIYLTAGEWSRLTRRLDMLAGHPLEEVYQVLVGRVDASYNVAHTVRELLNAGEPSSSVPPKELPAAIRRIGQARHRAEQQAKQFAGEVADLTDRLERVLPDVFELTLDGMADEVVRDMTGEVTEEAAGMIVDAGCAALRIASRLVTNFDVRDRDQARPVDHDPAARQFTITLDQPGDQSDYWTRPGQPPPAWTEQDRADLRLWGVTVNDAHPAVVYLTDHLGPLKGCSGSYDCRRALIANTLRDAADDVRVATSTTGAPHEDWIRRSAERLADLTDPPDRALGSLARLIRDASSYARSTIDRAKPCTICDGVGGVYGTHRLGCPNATTTGTT